MSSLLKDILRAPYRRIAARHPHTARCLRDLMLGPSAAPPTADEAPSRTSLPMAFLIDSLWCDIHGVYVQGWAHAFEHPVRRIVFTCADQQEKVEVFHSRPDLLNHYPEHAHVADTGFSVYLPFPPFQPITMELITDAGSAFAKVTVPSHLTAQAATAAAAPGAPLDQFFAAMRERRGVVLEIGARIVGDMTQSTAGLLGPDCRFIGFDIHPAPGVDIVGDAHVLSRYVGRAAVDGVMSVAVLEHLQAPWVVAAEINRALRPGGLTLQVVPQTWPVHEQPNDFWRMSDEGLKVLFGPALGFEVVTSGVAEPFAIIPPPNRRIGSWTSMPTSPGYGSAYILARKTAEIADDAVVWPAGDDNIIARSQAYPRH